MQPGLLSARAVESTPIPLSGLKWRGSQFLRLLTKCPSVNAAKNPTPRVFLATGNGLTVRRLGADHLWRRIPPM
jgi:hypothetical protein